MNLKFNRGGIFNKFKNGTITLTKPIKRLLLENCYNCTIILLDKCYTKVELIRCKNVKLIFKKQVYSLLIDMSVNIKININQKYKDLINIYNASTIDIFLQASNKSLPIKWSMFGEQWHNAYYKDEHFVRRTY